MDVRKPIKRKMKIKKSGSEWTWINFKYKNMPNFCAYCGIVGYKDTYCEKLFNCPNKDIDKPYGRELHVSRKKEVYSIGVK